MKMVLFILLIVVPTIGLADPRREHMRTLHAELEQITQQLKSLGNDSGVPGVEAQAADHLRAMESHLRHTRREVCGDCSVNAPPSSLFTCVEGKCVDGGAVTTALVTGDYVIYMRGEMPALHRQIHRLTRPLPLFGPRTPYERPRLLREYYDLVRAAIDHAQPTCTPNSPPEDVGRPAVLTSG
jgi:hypothetical protein